VSQIKGYEESEKGKKKVAREELKTTFIYFHFLRNGESAVETGRGFAVDGKWSMSKCYRAFVEVT